MKRQLIVSTAIVALMAGSAMAESANNMGNTNSSTTNNTATSMPDSNAATPSEKMDRSNTSASASGFTMAPTASAQVKFGTTVSSELMTSKLIGTSVYNNENESIGEIKDIALDHNKISGVVVSVGGFLGMGEKYVLVDPASIALQNDNGTWKARINSTKESLQSAPKFTYNESTTNKS